MRNFVEQRGRKSLGFRNDRDGFRLGVIKGGLGLAGSGVLAGEFGAMELRDRKSVV